MPSPSALDRGREAFDRHGWADAFDALSAADREAELDPEDLERLATAAYLVGRAESEELWVRAHNGFRATERIERAARCAFWLAFGLLQSGEKARAGAWLARAGRLLDEAGLDCVERGYLLLPEGLRSIVQGDAAGGYTTFERAAECATRFRDRDLAALAGHSRGRALIRLGRAREGVALLDEAMVAVEAGEVSPLVAGDVYCSVIEGCLEIFDLARAREWTAALSRWCESQPEMIPYSGQCLVRRAEVLQLHGDWPEAIDAARRASERLLQGPGRPAAGAAFYRQGELHRLSGAFHEAEDAYREASRWGRKPQPGLARLRLAQGQTDAAVKAIRLAMDEAGSRAARCQLLPAGVEILLAAGDLPAARAAADELSVAADDLDAPALHAAAAQALGAVFLAEGDASAALASLRRAWTLWHEIEAPYEAACTRLLTGLAYRDLGDDDGARLELEAARVAFGELGAGTDLEHAERLARPAAKAAGGLSPRETEVLRLVASGKTNRQIAADLFISERTVERHLSNIFTKLGLTSRAAATAYAYEHGIV